MDTSDDGMNPPLIDSTADLTGKIMVVAIIVLFLVVVFVLFLHLYAKWFWWRIEDSTVPSRESRNPRRRRLIFGQDPAAAAIKTGLDPAVLRSLPVLIFHSEDFKEGLECAVCLSELSQGEKARLLPKCNHGFHVECIDMWFQSHSTCPLCRNPVVLSSGCGGAAATAAGAEDLGENSGGESLNFPTNVLFWGNQTQVSSRGACLEEGHSSQSTTTTTQLPGSTNSRPEGMLVIDIPENHLSAALPSPATRVVAEEEMKSPMTTRLRSLKRLLSKEKRVVCPCSSSCVEAEQ